MSDLSKQNMLYEHVARIGKAVSSSKRLELLNLLAQSKKSVDALANEASIDIRLASAHLKTLRDAHLVKSRRDGKFMLYQLSGPDIAHLWVTMREVAETHLLELNQALNQITANPQHLVAFDRLTLLEQVKNGELIVIDVRPLDEYRTGHLPYARSFPLDELETRLAELPPDKEIVAYCRGPFCLMSDEAVALLAARGYRARKIRDGVSEWHAAGFPIESITT